MSTAYTKKQLSCLIFIVFYNVAQYSLITVEPLRVLLEWIVIVIVCLIV